MAHVVTHNAASVDGRIDGIEVDLGTFYDLAASFSPDAHLVGSDTLIEGMAGADDPAGGEAADPPPTDGPTNGADENPDAGGTAPLLVVPDSRGRVEDWEAVRAQPYWRGPLVLCSESTPASSLERLDASGVEYRVAGEDHVDYERALDDLEARDGIRTVLVDSGGTLSGHLLRAGLVDEVSVLVHPRVVGGTAARPFVRGPDPAGDFTADCSLRSVEQLEAELVWLRYLVEAA